MDKIHHERIALSEERLAKSEEQLLDAFFAEARQPLADDGFTERVMNALPARSAASALHRYSLWLNIIAAMGVVALLVYLGFFTRTWDFLQSLMAHIVVGTLSYDYDGLLVQAMLLLHRLPEMLPSAPQLTAIAVTTITLMTMGIKRLANEVTA